MTTLHDLEVEAKRRVTRLRRQCSRSGRHRNVMTLRLWFDDRDVRVCGHCYAWLNDEGEGKERA